MLAGTATAPSWVARMDYAAEFGKEPHEIFGGGQRARHAGRPGARTCGGFCRLPDQAAGPAPPARGAGPPRDRHRRSGLITRGAGRRSASPRCCRCRFSSCPASTAWPSSSRPASASSSASCRRAGPHGSTRSTPCALTNPQTRSRSRPARSRSPAACGRSRSCWFCTS